MFEAFQALTVRSRQSRGSGFSSLQQKLTKCRLFGKSTHKRHMSQKTPSYIYVHGTFILGKVSKYLIHSPSTNNSPHPPQGTWLCKYDIRIFMFRKMRTSKPKTNKLPFHSAAFSAVGEVCFWSLCLKASRTCGERQTVEVWFRKHCDSGRNNKLPPTKIQTWCPRLLSSLTLTLHLRREAEGPNRRQVTTLMVNLMFNGSASPYRASLNRLIGDVCQKTVSQSENISMVQDLSVHK